MSGFLEVAKAFVEPLSKLIDTVARGCGIVYEPTHKKRLAKAKAVEISTIAQAIRDNDDLPIFYNKDGVQIDSTDVKALAERASSRLMLQEMRKQQNIEAIVDKAYEELKNETEVSSEPVDDDWIVRFFNSVEDVSNEKIQEIWGRVLAGEIRHPYSFSLRTLETLKNLSQHEAQLFQRYSDYILHYKDIYFLPSERQLDAEYAITDSDINILDDSGLISNRGHGLRLSIDEQQPRICNDQIVGLFQHPAYPSDYPALASYYLSKAGIELYKVVRSMSGISEEYAIKYFRLLKQEYTYIKISAHRIVETNGFYISNEETDLI